MLGNLVLLTLQERIGQSVLLHYKQEDISQNLQRHNEVRWRPGQEASLAPPCSNLRFFGSKHTALKKVLVM